MIQPFHQEKTLGDTEASHKGFGVQFAAERYHHISPASGLQPASFTMDRIIKRLMWHFPISHVHARVVVEMSGIGGRK